MTPPIICMKLESDPPAEAAPTHLTLPFLIFLPLQKVKNKEELERESGDLEMEIEMEWKQANQGHNLIKLKPSSSQPMVMVSSWALISKYLDISLKP